MSVITNFTNTKDFLEFNKRVIKDNYFIFYPPISMMFNPKVSVMQLYNLEDKDGSNAYCLWLSGNYIIHSLNWNDNTLDSLTEIIELENYSKFTFTGQKDLLLKLFDRKKVKYEILKDRLIYECSQTEPLTDVRGQLVLADEADTTELSQMSYQYHLDEYAENAQRDFEYMSRIVQHGIKNNNIYKLINDGEIVSMAQVISQGQNNPLIGQLFTKKKFRNKGFASSILFQLTDLLFDSGHAKCGLLSDLTNVSSNKVFRKVGYKSIYSQISIYKK